MAGSLNPTASVACSVLRGLHERRVLSRPLLHPLIVDPDRYSFESTAIELYLSVPPVAMCLWRGKRSSKEEFPIRNWPIILGLQLLVSTAYFIFTPSIYQFITTPRSRPEDQTYEEGSTKFWPGLGEPETLYAWVLMAGGIGEIVFLPVIGCMAGNLPYTISQLVALSLYAAGGIIYALASEGWMVIIGRTLIGCARASAVVVHTYIGEMGTRMDEVRRKEKKRPIKFALYIAFSFILNGGYSVAFLVTSLMAQFPSVNPYRWPGWFLAALALIYALVVLSVFRETRPCSLPKRWKRCSCATGMKLSAQLSSKWHIHLIAYTFLITSGFVIGQLHAMLNALVTPVLSDQFGFDITTTSHYLIGMAVVFLASSVIQLGTKVMKMDNRLLLALAFIMGLIGSILIGDWQAIGHDPCLSANGAENLNESANSSELTDTDYDQSGMFSTASLLNSGSGAMYYSGDLLLSPLSQSDGTNISSNSTQPLSERCEALSSSSHQCFWNPHSRITGEYCNTCHASCHSEQKSSNFYQFSAGVLLVSLASSFGFVFVSAIASAYTPVESQGTVLSLVLGSGILSRTVSPLWLVETYELSGKHTYISMAIIAGSLMIMLLLLIALYKELAPRFTPREGNVLYYVAATFDTKAQESTDTFIKHVHNWMEQSACSVSTFVPKSRNAVFSEETPQDFILHVDSHHHQEEVTFVIGDLEECVLY